MIKTSKTRTNGAKKKYINKEQKILIGLGLRWKVNFRKSTRCTSL